MISPLVEHFAVFMIHVYRNSFRLLFLRTCNFSPPCSQYAEEAIRKHGPIAGAWLSVKRLARCHPWTSPAIDLVP